MTNNLDSIESFSSASWSKLNQLIWNKKIDLKLVNHFKLPNVLKSDKKLSLGWVIDFGVDSYIWHFTLSRLIPIATDLHWPNIFASFTDKIFCQCKLTN